MKVEIFVTPKKSVFDPQGDAVLRCLHSQGLEKAVSVRIGKFIELEVDATEGELNQAKLDEICNDILSNPIIEDYRVHVVPAPAVAEVVTPAPVIDADPKQIASAAEPAAEETTVATVVKAVTGVAKSVGKKVAATVSGATAAVAAAATSATAKAPKGTAAKAPVPKTEKSNAFAKTKSSVGKVLPVPAPATDTVGKPKSKKKN